ncbi:MAG: hypothetical protein RQ735_02735 [Flavobacteriaceae bacterium]|nr:hypothetical protein [Flavobacteriaceae bacterium]
MSTSNNKIALKKIDGEEFLKISEADLMRPFFMNIASAYNHWMFISSNGGLTAGRKNANYALFPYTTDDKITESVEITGSKTIIKTKQNTEIVFWEPFSIRFADQYRLTQNLYKNIYGNKIVFEQINHSLGLRFRYGWSSCDTFGFIKSVSLTNISESKIELECIDGLQNILPAGVVSDLQTQSSNLVDAYKRSELHLKSGLGIYALSAVPVDKAEPSEALTANVCWSLGVKNPLYLLSSLQLENFRKGQTLVQETDIKAEKGAYLVHQARSLQPDETVSWKIIADVNYDQTDVTALIHKITNHKELYANLEKDIAKGTDQLLKLIAAADGVQCSGDKLRDIRHYSNCMYNIMRGGIFDNNYSVEQKDFETYLQNANKNIYRRYAKSIAQLGVVFSLDQLRALELELKDKDFSRLSLEYLPLKFSRRHGDPSRPWNRFSINTKAEDGSKILDYEGNWRDIFQNWESLAYSYPNFVESMISKFLNASTFDGYNPYRVTKDGFDWEIIEPDDPWSYIGYWGDHQIIYLLKLLEHLDHLSPKKLPTLFAVDAFVYAHVPYKIKTFEEILSDPKDTIIFDREEDKKIRENRETLGADGTLLTNKEGQIIHVNFLEKILAVTLAKFSNFIPEGGIWMNTQRPEWNDANNALVGNGVSMVTLYYIRRFLSFFERIFSQLNENETYPLSDEMYRQFEGILQALETHQDGLSGRFSPEKRRAALEALGSSASRFREQIYTHKFSGKKTEISVKSLKSFVDLAISYTEHSIRANKRPDGMYHAYNLMTVNADQGVAISYLDEMLEGQVAVLSAHFLSSNEALEVLDSLKNSALFREDQYSYILYPNKNLKGFLDRNTLAENAVKSSELLTQLVQDEHKGIIRKDAYGQYHFHPEFRNAKDLKTALAALEDTVYAPLAKSETNKVLDLYESVFNHKAFTGRSGTFYGYEGLGSIYWHMVSKLLLAVQECCQKAALENADPTILGRLLEHYYEINEGIGVHKSPELYGAFPTDPYSHTPLGKGAQQPGMTGQVKEDILSRFGELGVVLENGILHFKPYLLRKVEFSENLKTFRYIDLQGETEEIPLSEPSVCFTFCQVPVIYSMGVEDKLEVLTPSGMVCLPGQSLTPELSRAVFGRTAEVISIKVFIKPTILK